MFDKVIAWTKIMTQLSIKPIKNQDFVICFSILEQIMIKKIDLHFRFWCQKPMGGKVHNSESRKLI